MTKIETNNLIINKLLSDGWDIESCYYWGRGPVVAHKNFAKVEISTEECLCHGGRLWITDLHTGNNYELAHATYCPSLSITDSSSELAYIIENEMIPKLREFSSFIYKVTVINEFGPNSDGTTNEKVRYYNNPSALVKAVTEDSNCIKDILALQTYTYRVPNGLIKYTTERIHKPSPYPHSDSELWFVVKRWVRDNTYAEWELARTCEKQEIGRAHV